LSVVIGLSSQPPIGIEAITINHSHTFEKFKTTIVRANTAATTTMPPLVDMALQDSHGASIASKQKEKDIVSTCLHVSKLTT